MVVIAELPMLSTGVMQERVATPSTCTVQAPHSAMPQPKYVPVTPRTSRNTHKSGVSPPTSTVRLTPLTLIVVGMTTSWLQGLSPGCTRRRSKACHFVLYPAPDGARNRSNPSRRRWAGVEWGREPSLAAACLKCHINSVLGHRGSAHAARRFPFLARVSAADRRSSLRLRARQH